MEFLHYSKEQQAHGAFNGGEIIENKPLGFPQDGSELSPYSNLFYWANAIALKDSTIGLHPHKGFEIMSFVLAGTIKHYDTQMNDWKALVAGDVQIIRSGNGISHAEFMQKDARMFQIWFDPNLSKSLAKEASYDDYSLEMFKVYDLGSYSKKNFVGGDAPILMDTPVEIYELEINGETSLELDNDKHYSIYVLNGEGTIAGREVVTDDFIICRGGDKMDLSAGLKLFVVSADQQMEYKTYA